MHFTQLLAFAASATMAVAAPATADEGTTAPDNAAAGA